MAGPIHDTPDRRIAVVTGAARGIGAAIAVELARRGIVPVLAVRQPDAAATVREQVEALGTPCHVIACDVRLQDEVAALVAEVLQRCGRLDAVVNNAGRIDPIGRLEDTDPADWADSIATNLVGPSLLIRAALPALRRRGGAVVNISSGAALTPREGWSAYCSAKAALAMLGRSVALEYGGDGVAVYGFQPGVVDTDMQATIRASGINEISRIPRDQLAPPERAARVAAWLVDARPADLRGQELSIADPRLVARVDSPRAAP